MFHNVIYFEFLKVIKLNASFIQNSTNPFSPPLYIAKGGIGVLYSNRGGEEGGYGRDRSESIERTREEGIAVLTYNLLVCANS